HWARRSNHLARGAERPLQALWTASPARRTEHQALRTEHAVLAPSASHQVWRVWTGSEASRVELCAKPACSAEHRNPSRVVLCAKCACHARSSEYFVLSTLPRR